MTIAKIISCVALILILILCVSGIFNIVDYEYSTDVEQLFFKHSFECQSGDIFWEFNTITEPGLYISNILTPVCASNIYEYTYILALTVLIMKILVAIKFENVLESIVYLAFSFVFLDLYTQTHLYRQILSSYLMLIWLNDGRRDWRIILISLIFHNATTMILFIIFNFRVIIKILRQHYYLVFLFGAPILFYISDITIEAGLVEYLFYRYGFAFSDNKLSILDSYVLSLLKYFIAGIILGCFDKIVNKKNNLLNISVLCVVFFCFSIVFNFNGEFVFRILVPFKFVIVPYLISVTFIRLLKKMAFNSTKFLVIT